MIFGGVGCVISNIRLDFDGDPLLNADQGISKGILFWRCGSGAIQGILLVTQKVADEFLRFFLCRETSHPQHTKWIWCWSRHELETRNF